MSISLSLSLSVSLPLYRFLSVYQNNLRTGEIAVLLHPTTNSVTEIGQGTPSHTKNELKGWSWEQTNSQETMLDGSRNQNVPEWRFFTPRRILQDAYRAHGQKVVRKSSSTASHRARLSGSVHAWQPWQIWYCAFLFLLFIRRHF